jgi:hypothetical protein
LDDIVICVSDHDQTQCLQNLRSLCIVFYGFCVAVAVYFNDQPEFGTIEIDDVVVYGLLTEKFVTGKLPHAENFVPNFAFGLSRILAVFAGTIS